MTTATAEPITTTTVESQRKAVCENISSWTNAPEAMKSGRVDQKQLEYLNKLLASQDRAKAMGKQPVTVINLNPYPLMVNSPLFDGLVVKPVTGDEGYQALVIEDVKYAVNTGLDHNHTPEEFWPIQLANEFVNQYREKGGVFIVKGNLATHPELAKTPEFKKSEAEARETLFVYARKTKAAADAEWNRPNKSGRANIHSQHRLMAKILFDARHLPKLPEWYDDFIAAEDIAPLCEGCKSELKKGAYICPTCARIADPIAAFKDNAIDENHSSLERLTRAQVEELGVSAFVAETADERSARLKSGKPKPLSRFAIEMEREAQKEAKAANEKKD